MGKWLPWVLAGIAGAFALTMVVKFAFFPSPTKPSLTVRRGMLSFHRPEESLAVVLGADPDGAGDAAGDYKLAMDVYRENRQAIEEILDRARAGDVARGEYRYTPDQLALLNKIAAHVGDGAGKRKMSFYFRLSPKEIKRPYYPVEAYRFMDLYDVLDVLAMHHALVAGEQAYPQAEKCLFHALVMGRHMVDERARMNIVEDGLVIQESACETLIQLYRRWKKPARVGKVKNYRGGLLEVTSKYADLHGALWGVLSPWRCPHPGDAINLAGNHRDRAIRVEAIIILGMVRHGQIHQGDKRMVKKLINKYLKSKDEIEAAAAKAARDMTQQDVRMIAGERYQLEATGGWPLAGG